MKNNERISNFLIYVICIFISIVTLYPFLHSFLLSFSPHGYSFSRGIHMIDDFGLSSWKTITQSSYMWRGFYNSVIRVVLGSSISLVLQVTMAYPLSKKRFMGYKTFNFMIVLSTVINAGLIPNYILVRNLNMVDTIWALLLPGAISGFNVIVLKNFYAGLPSQIEEAAKIDGANDLQIFFKIIIYMAIPSISTIALWTIVGNWNAWFDVVLYISDRNKMLLPAILREIVVDEVDSSFTTTALGDIQPDSDSRKAAATMFVTIPVLLVYPFLQRFFVTGITVGAVKG